MRQFYFSLLFASLALAAPLASAREWTDSTGTRKCEGTFVRLDGNMVHMDGPAGKKLATRFERLSTRDQEYVLTQISPSQDPFAGVNYQLARDTRSTSVLRQAADTRTQFVMQEAVPLAADSSLTAEDIPEFKHAYIGECGAFHLHGNIGTALFRFQEPGMAAQQYLVGLSKVSAAPSRWIYFRPSIGAPLIQQFAFDRIPMPRKGYAVWYLDHRSGWQFFQYAYHLPNGALFPPGYGPGTAP